MTKNKNHWYDGWFYDILIAPNQDHLFEQIKNLVDADSKIIDVGCGTGRLAFGLADKFKSVLGIDSWISLFTYISSICLLKVNIFDQLRSCCARQDAV